MTKTYNKEDQYVTYMYQYIQNLRIKLNWEIGDKYENNNNLPS